MYPKLRAIHLCTALFCLPFLLMYAVSGVQMAHRRWFPLRSCVAVRNVRLPAGIADARAAARELRVRGELAAVQASAGGLRFRIAGPGAVHEVEYSIATGIARVRTTDSGFAGTLNRIHQAQGLWHEDALVNAWAAALGVVSLGLLVLGATGLYLWFRIHGERWIGCVLLAAGGGLAAALIVSMRVG